MTFVVEVIYFGKKKQIHCVHYRVAEKIGAIYGVLRKLGLMLGTLP